MKSHPLADLFPMMPDDEIQSLADDIAANGQTNEIVLYQGQILDGRNRFKACKLAGVEPVTTEFEGDESAARAMVISLNVKRRNMTAGQLALLAAKMLPEFEKDREKNQKDALNKGKEKGNSRLYGTRTNGRATDDAAKVFNVGRESIQQADALLEESPDLAIQVNERTITLNKAFDELKARREANRKREGDAARIAHYREKVEAGEMTWEEAMQNRAEEERKKNEQTRAWTESQRMWLRDFIKTLEWIENLLSEMSEGTLGKYFSDSEPGWFEHGITPKRLGKAIASLENASKFCSGETQHAKKK